MRKNAIRILSIIALVLFLSITAVSCSNGRQEPAQKQPGELYATGIGSDFPYFSFDNAKGIWRSGQGEAFAYFLDGQFTVNGDILTCTHSTRDLTIELEFSGEDRIIIRSISGNTKLTAWLKEGDVFTLVPKDSDPSFSDALSDEENTSGIEPEPGTTETIEDTRAPFFVYAQSYVTIYRDKEFNLHKYVSYIDDYDPDVELSVTGSVDTTVAGVYPLQLTITDDSGNSSSMNMNVTVAEPVPVTPGGTGTAQPTDPPPEKKFSDFSAKYKKEGTEVGIDVSRWQGKIDFNKVAAAGCEFVIIRIGGFSDGVFEDGCYAENIKNARAAGLKIGIYWYSEENSAAMVHENADYLYSLLNGEKLDFPIFFDWEDYYDLEDYKMSIRDMNEMFLAFKAEAESHGYKAALYNSPFYLGLLWSEEVKKDGVWLAHYTTKTDYGGEYFLWQQGIWGIDGIDGDVDVDVFYPSAMP